MSMLRATGIVVACLVAVPGVTRAGDFHYECTVISAGTLTDKGTLAPHWTNKSMVGAKFTVDRVTGRIIGGPLDNANLKVEVIDRGTHEMSFQAFSRSTQKNTHVPYRDSGVRGGRRKAVYWHDDAQLPGRVFRHMQVNPNRRINTDPRKRRSAPLARAGYAER